MLHLAVFLLYTHAVSALFFHEKSSIVLAPTDGHNNISFGYSLGYQRGEHPSLVIGAPQFDMTGRVYQRSVEDILSGRTECDPLDINFDALNITYNRTRSPDQHFYMGASIAATENFFMTTAPLRTEYAVEAKYDNGTVAMQYNAYGACFIYDQSKNVSACRDYGLEYVWKQKQYIKDYIIGGAGWSTLVDEPKQRIIVSKSFGIRDVVYGTLNPSDSYISLKSAERLKITVLKSITNYGKAMTVGNYFNKNINTTYYAFSSTDMAGRGAVDFYSSDGNWKTSTKIRLEDKSVGVMFGAALCSSDVTGDGRADLIVGAPAKAADATSCDRGAVHVYTKSISNKMTTMVLKLTIWGVKDGARFGSTLTVNDVNGDSYPEIFISAPFENSGVGALYILCGFEVHTLVDKKKILVTQLKRTQIIEKETHRLFGFSLQPVADFNENGGAELAVGAPGDSRVLLFSGIRAITVKVTSKFADTVLQSDSGHSYLNFSSCVIVDLPLKPKKITTKLLVNNILTGKGVFNNSDEATYEIDLATEEGNRIADNRVEYCKHMHIVDASFCVVNTTVSTAGNIQEHEVFNSTWVTLSAVSEVTKITPATVLECMCQNASCAPEFQTELQWFGNKGTDEKVTDYIIGSSLFETVNVLLRNHGTKGCSSCVIVRVSGKLGLQLQCQATDVDRQYKCALPNPFMANTTHKIEIQLSMDKLSNRERNVIIYVEARKNCDEPEPETVTSLTVPYSFTDVLDNVFVDGTSMDGEISDIEIDNEDEELIYEQTYTILNNRSFIWKNVGVRVAASKKPYIQNIRAIIKNTDKYSESNDTYDFSWQSALTLAPNSEYEVTIYTTINKKEIEPHLKNGRITISSELALDLFPEKTKSKELKTVIDYKKEKTIWHNKMLITIIALLAAMIVLIIITVILYKLDFFRRRNKEKLKQEIRKRSIRRESSRRRPESEAHSEAPSSAYEIVECPEATTSPSRQPDAELNDTTDGARAQLHEDSHAHCD